MESMVNLITMVKDTIKELETKEKEINKAFIALKEEKEDVTRNLVMFRGTLEDLIRRKDNEIQIVMGEKPKEAFEEESTKNEEKTVEEKKTKKERQSLVYAIDEHNEVIAKYASCCEAGRDLKLNSTTVRYRMEHITIETQINKFGYALVRNI